MCARRVPTTSSVCSDSITFNLNIWNLKTETNIRLLLWLITVREDAWESSEKKFKTSHRCWCLRMLITKSRNCATKYTVNFCVSCVNKQYIKLLLLNDHLVCCCFLFKLHFVFIWWFLKSRIDIKCPVKRMNEKQQENWLKMMPKVY